MRSESYQTPDLNPTDFRKSKLVPDPTGGHKLEVYRLYLLTKIQTSNRKYGGKRIVILNVTKD